MKKVLFLDIDGVLNSLKYDRERGPNDGNIDESRLPLLKRLVDETAAVIVLSSSWRKHLYGDDPLGQELIRTFDKYDLTVADKTPILNGFDRAEEIRSWLVEHAEEVEDFVIFDDIVFGWGDLSEHLVRTDARIGRGLEEVHIQKAKMLLG